MNKPKILLIMSFCCLSLVCYHFCQTKAYNSKLEKNFTYTKTSGKTAQYRDHVPMQYMNLDVYINYVIVSLEREKENSFILPCDMIYYKDVDGRKTRVISLKKGTEVLIQSSAELQRAVFGYGITSFPTYEKGWRFVRPFVESGSIDDNNDEYYYIKLRSLKKAAKAIFEQTGRRTENMLLSFDRDFYDQGIYCSLDLKKDCWTWIETVYVCLSAVFMILYLITKGDISHEHSKSRSQKRSEDPYGR